MESESPDPGRLEEDGGPSSESEESGERELELDRLPPPAFPPGSRRRAVRAGFESLREAEEAEEGYVPSDAFISPDDPINREDDDVPEDAFISPDDPIVRSEDDDDDEGVVTGISEDGPVYGAIEAGPEGRFGVQDAARILGRLAEDLGERGAAAVEVDPGTSTFEATLRAFIAGFLVGTGERD